MRHDTAWLSLSLALCTMTLVARIGRCVKHIAFCLGFPYDLRGIQMSVLRVGHSCSTADKVVLGLAQHNP